MKIDKNIPVPEVHPTSKIGKLVAKMKEGDSIFTTKYIERQQIAKTIRDNGWKAKARMYARGHRIWRVK